MSSTQSEFTAVFMVHNNERNSLMTDIFVKIGATSYNKKDYRVPAERTFRNAWEVEEGSAVISVNLSKAKDIWRHKIRQARVEPLLKLDSDFMKALESGEDTTEIVAKKQALRDAPNLSSIEEAKSVSEILSIQPIPNVTIE